MDAKKARARNGKYTKVKLIKILEMKRKEIEFKLETAEQLFRKELTQTSVFTKTHPADMDNPIATSINSARIDNLRKCLGKIELARQKVKQGTFGFCAVCKDPIPIDRLKTVPFTEYCEPCKTDMGHT